MVLPHRLHLRISLPLLLVLIYIAGGLPSAAETPNALLRLRALHLSHLDGSVPTYYSIGTKAQALRDQTEISDCAAWYASQLHVTPSITLAVLNQSDWDRIHDLAPYPMPQAMAGEGDVVFMPDSFQTFPGRDPHVDSSRELNFIAFHETGHIFQHATSFVAPDLFLQEFYATTLATAYALHARPELVPAVLHARKDPTTKPRYTSFEDMDLIYFGVGFDNYDWLQIETVRLALFFVRGQDLASVLRQMQSAFPPGKPVTIAEVFNKLDAIRPGFRTQAGSLADPTTLPLLTPGTCVGSNRKGQDEGYVGVWNKTDQPVTLIEEGNRETAPPGYSCQQNKVGVQFQLPSGRCITYPKTPGYIVLQ